MFNEFGGFKEIVEINETRDHRNDPKPVNNEPSMSIDQLNAPIVFAQGEMSEEDKLALAELNKPIF